jgi:hypothetical protein
MPFIKDQDVIQAVAPERPDQRFNIWVRPGRPWRDRTVPNPHRPLSFPKIPSGRIRALRENQGIIRRDACHAPSEPSSDLAPSSSQQSCADCIIATRGYDFREEQVWKSGPSRELYSRNNFNLKYRVYWPQRRFILRWRAGRELGTVRLRLQDPQHHRRGQYGQGRRISGEAAHAGGG